MRRFSPLLLVFLVGCDGLPNNSTPDGGSGAKADGWTQGSHPCATRTDDLWFDDVERGWLGCGQASDGQGFWTTTDSGLTWSLVETDAPGFFNDFRVNDIFRDPTTQRLYAAGTGGGHGVIGLDGDTPVDVWTPGNTIDDSFPAGSFRVTSTGFAVVESLTGTGLMTRASESDAWTAVGTAWASDGSSHQILDLDVHEDRFYAVGSTISEPPQVFLPSGTEGFELTPRVLSDNGRGELWALDVDASGIVVGGVDQEADRGRIFSFAFPGDPLTGDWNEFNLATLWPDDATWVRAVCRAGEHVVAVGGFSQRNDGFVLESSDGGATFTDVTPEGLGDVPPLWDCWVHDDGSFVVTGEGGFAARHEP